MLFSNIYNAIIDVGNGLVYGDDQTVSNILTTLYKQSNSTEVVIPIGNTTIAWNSTQTSNTTYLNTLNQLSDPQITYLLFNLFEKVFESYSIQPPPSYTDLSN